MDEQRKWFLEMKSTHDKDAMRIIKMPTKYLEYYINLVEKAEAEFERIDINFGRSSAVDKTLSNNIACYRKIVCEKSIDVADFIVIFF